MQPQTDLSTVNRQLQAHQANIAEAQKQSMIERQKADQRRADGDQTTADYLEREAERFDQQAGELQAEITQLTIDKERLEKRISDLEQARAQLSGGDATQIATIDSQLATLRGLR